MKYRLRIFDHGCYLYEEDKRLKMDKTFLDDNIYISFQGDPIVYNPISAKRIKF